VLLPELPPVAAMPPVDVEPLEPPDPEDDDEPHAMSPRPTSKSSLCMFPGAQGYQHRAAVHVAEEEALPAG
jgi:hypothetical protein